jgi:hypothetical protein
MRGPRPITILALSALMGGVAPATLQAQADPFGALHPTQPGSSSGRTGGTGVSTAVGRSYAAYDTTGVASLAQIAFLPKTVAPIPVQLKGWNAKFLKARPRIAVPSYALGFVRGAHARASAAGAGSEIVPRATSITTKLVGVSDELAARLADEAYADLIKRLGAAGFEVVAAAETQAAPHLQGLKRTPVGGGKGGDGGGVKGFVTYSPSAAPLIRGQALDQGMSTPGVTLALGHVSKELDAVLITPQLLIDHLRIESTGRRMYVGNASVDAELRFRINGVSRVDFCYGNEKGGTMPGAFQVQPTGSDEPFGVMYEMQDRSDSVPLHNALVEAGFGSLYRQSLVYGVEVVPERFAALTRAAYQGFNQALVDEIVRARR